MLNSKNDISWQNGDYIKHKNLKTLLENRAKTLQPMIDFNLSNSNLENINLVNAGSKKRFYIYQCKSLQM